jgi:hypothetical protein
MGETLLSYRRTNTNQTPNCQSSGIAQSQNEAPRVSPYRVQYLRRLHRSPSSSRPNHTKHGAHGRFKQPRALHLEALRGGRQTYNRTIRVPHAR